MWTKVLSRPKKVLWPPGVNLTPNQTDMGMQPWWMTCSVVTWLVFLRNTKKICGDAQQVDLWMQLPGAGSRPALWSVTHRIHEFGELRKVVPPAGMNHLIQQIGSMGRRGVYVSAIIVLVLWEFLRNSVGLSVARPYPMQDMMHILLGTKLSISLLNTVENSILYRWNRAGSRVG